MHYLMSLPAGCEVTMPVMHFALYPQAFMEGLGGPEMMLILFIVLLLFGGQKLPELAKGLGKSIREFKKAASSVEDEFKRAIEEAPEPPKPAPKPVTPAAPAILPPSATDEKKPT
jgi:TatA/E family protein of Tat protein translocase